MLSVKTQAQSKHGRGPPTRSVTASGPRRKGLTGHPLPRAGAGGAAPRGPRRQHPPDPLGASSCRAGARCAKPAYFQVFNGSDTFYCAFWGPQPPWNWDIVKPCCVTHSPGTPGSAPRTRAQPTVNTAHVPTQGQALRTRLCSPRSREKAPASLCRPCGPLRSPPEHPVRPPSPPAGGNGEAGPAAHPPAPLGRWTRAVPQGESCLPLVNARDCADTFLAGSCAFYYCVVYSWT